MIELMTVSWAQSALIEAGAVLQVVAICAFIQDKLSVRLFPRGGHEFPDEEDESEEDEHAAEVAQRSSEIHAATARNWKPEARSTMTASDLGKTKKVGFKQTLKFH
jgi:hypothetical protein